jgi:hypothetical protein
MATASGWKLFLATGLTLSPAVKNPTFAGLFCCNPMCQFAAVARIYVCPPPWKIAAQTCAKMRHTT